ncbi:hypothetical protein [Streptococcus suis]|uniref:Uncharacterized protein n=1 Tax=Streptococcus suis R61 TaxID=996306 RepID=A0AA87F717_STRSU|nr:hypothetical protein [Streptococcus suis]ATZ04700.1 hypothetical protein CVO91_12780 [Streptococcus suis]EHC02105.1 hypothetical protein SSUR61_1519 [Streptococcus suis R61]MBY4955186.1 hypothetical protein [Streptococcus suis]MBY4971485.1 hypothetical protein [Streptococcus suis]MBY4981310.1 hypothetical protein [Streptococcus suis]
MHNTKEMICRFTLDSIPQKILDYQEKYQKGHPKKKKYFLYNFLYDATIDNGDNEAYYGGSKKSTQQRITKIKNGKREAMTSMPIKLIAENMKISVSELLWGKKEDWKSLLPALFYIVIFDALNDIKKGTKEKFSLQERAIEALKPSVVFASRLAKNEIESDFSFESISFDIHDKKLAQVIFRLYQPEIEQQFYKLFKQMFIDSNYELGYLDAKLKVFAHQVIDKIEKWNEKQTSIIFDSLGHQIYKTYNLYYSHEMREYRSSLIFKRDERYSKLNYSHYLEKEQQMIVEAIEHFVTELEMVQTLQDERLGYRKTDKKLFKIGFDLAGFDKEYFHTTEVQIEQEQLSIDKLEEDIKKAYEDNTLPI